MEAFKNNDRIIMVLDDETYKSFEYKGRKALSIVRAKESLRS